MHKKFFLSKFTFVSRDLGDEKETFWKQIWGINLCFWEAAHLPSPKLTFVLTSYLEQNDGLGDG